MVPDNTLEISCLNMITAAISRTGMNRKRHDFILNKKITAPRMLTVTKARLPVQAERNRTNNAGMYHAGFLRT